MRATPTRSRAGRRLAVAAAISVGAVLAAIVVPSGSLSALDGSRARPTATRRRTSPRRRPRDPPPRGRARSTCADGTPHPPQRALDDGTRPRPQRPARRRTPSPAAAATDRRRDRRPDHPGAGPSRGRRRGGAARRRPSRSSPTSRSARRTPPRRPTATTCSTPATASSRRRTGRWLAGATTPTFTAHLDRRRRPALLQAHRARPLPALQPHEDLPRRRASPPSRYAADAGPTSNWVATMPKQRTVPVPDPRQGLPDRHRLARPRSRAPGRCSGCACAAVAPTSPRSAPTSPATRSPA